MEKIQVNQTPPSRRAIYSFFVGWEVGGFQRETPGVGRRPLGTGHDVKQLPLADSSERNYQSRRIGLPFFWPILKLRLSNAFTPEEQVETLSSQTGATQTERRK